MTDAVTDRRSPPRQVMSVPAKRPLASHKTWRDLKEFYIRFYVSTAVKTAGYDMAQSGIRAPSFYNKTVPSPPRGGLKPEA